MEKKSIRVNRTNNGTPSLWENYREFENVKRSVTVFDNNGDRLEHIFTKYDNSALVPIREGYYILKKFLTQTNCISVEDSELEILNDKIVIKDNDTGSFSPYLNSDISEFPNFIDYDNGDYRFTLNSDVVATGDIVKLKYNKRLDFEYIYDIMLFIRRGEIWLISCIRRKSISVLEIAPR
jgi:hypothetical protein